MENNNIQQQIYQQQRSNKKYFAIIIMLLLIIGLSIGYAVLTASFRISGTSIIDDGAQWDVGPKDEDIHDTVNCLNNVKCTLTTPEEASELTPDDGTTPGSNGAIFWMNGNTLYFKHLLVQPGDSLSFTAKYENTGTINAVIDSYNITPFSGVAASFLSHSVKYGPGTVDKNGTVLYEDGASVTAGQNLPAGATAVFKVTVTYIETGTLPTSDQIAAINNVDPQTGKANGSPTAFTVTYKQA